MTESKDIPVFYLSDEIKKQFRDTRDLLDQILETFEILEDQELMKEIKQAEEEYQKGETISFDELKKELT
ncbi:MAG: hypothetical protein INQ03_16510 [Candidatus Heimdallarchaeota archaeon]|nr:hypothetical protein [Candidatus Heimdallarchaeota archaeon]